MRRPTVLTMLHPPSAVPVVSAAAADNANWLHPGSGSLTDLLQTYSLMVATFLGTMGLPHVLVRFYTNPDGKLYILNRKYGYFYTPGQNQAQRVPAKQISDLQSPIRFLLGHTHLQREIRGLHIASQQNGLYTLQGVPRHMEKQISSLSLTVTANGVIRKIHIVETDGVTNEFHFSGETDNVPVPASAFEFHPPIGVAIVDGSSPMQ